MSKGTVLSMRRQVLSFLFLSTMSGLLATMVLLLLLLLLLLLFISSFTVFAGVLFVDQPCTNHAPGASVTDGSQSFCPYTKHLPENSSRSQHADLLGPCHRSSLCYFIIIIIIIINFKIIIIIIIIIIYYLMIK